MHTNGSPGQLNEKTDWGDAIYGLSKSQPIDYPLLHCTSHFSGCYRTLDQNSEVELEMKSNKSFEKDKSGRRELSKRILS